MTHRSSGAGKFAVVALAVAAAIAMPFGASAHGHGGGHYSGHSYGGHSYGGHSYSGHSYVSHGYGRGYGYGYGHRGYWSGNRWIAGAIVTGAVVGLINNATRPAYYDAPVVYTQPRTVVYEDAPVETRRVVETRTVIYNDPSQTRYIRDDGYDGD